MLESMIKIKVIKTKSKEKRRRRKERERVGGEAWQCVAADVEKADRNCSCKSCHR